MSNNLPKDYRKGVPGVPQAALNAIGDENTRVVLQSIIDGWNVRNGSSGDGNSRFITAAELGEVRGQIGGLAGGGSSDGSGSNSIIRPGQVAQAINDIQASIMASRLWQELGERITLIDLRSLQTATGLTEEVTNRSNSDNAIVQVINTMWAVIGNSGAIIQGGSSVTSNAQSAVATNWNTLQTQVGLNTSAIQTEALTRANADGTLFAQYTVKIDQNGYVSGYGLASTANNSTPFSDFIVRADRFSIGSPSGPGITPQIPFIVLTTPQVYNGRTRNPGVYIKDAFIAEGTIDRAKIGVAAIDTLLLENEAVTVSRYLSTYSNTSTYVWTNTETIVAIQDIVVPNIGTYIENGVLRYYKQKFAITGLQNIYPVTTSQIVSWVLRIGCVNQNETHPFWNSGVAYGAGSIVAYNIKYKSSPTSTATSDFTKFYISLINNNTFDPTYTTAWKDLTALNESGVSVGSGGTFTGTVGYVELEPGSYRFCFGVYMQREFTATGTGFNMALSAIIQSAKR